MRSPPSRSRAAKSALGEGLPAGDSKKPASGGLCRNDGRVPVGLKH
jgi:hypothetical protein